MSSALAAGPGLPLPRTAVSHRHWRPRSVSTQNGELVLQHDDVQSFQSFDCIPRASGSLSRRNAT
jgi:hypothetical protein